MTAFGDIAYQAAKRLKKLKKGDDGTAPPSAPSVSRAPGPAPKPRGSDLGNDAKNIKIRQDYEEIPEAGMRRANVKKKSKWF